MTPNRFAPLTVALLLAMMSSTAQAFFDPPWITPATPRVGEVVSVNIHGGICDAIFEHSGYPSISQVGNVVRVLEYGDHVDTADLCIYGVGTLAVPIGTYPTGNYTVTVDLTYDNYPFGYETITLGVVPFTVTGATPAAPVPVATPLWKFVLLVLITCIAARAHQMRRRRSR